MRLQIGDWTVEPENDRIERQGEKRVLRPQVMNILAYLAERPRQTVTSEELMAVLWPGKVVTPGTLYNAVNELRQALDDDARNPRYVRTVPKRGYRLIAPVSPASPEGRERISAFPDEAKFRPTIQAERRRNWAGAAVLVLALALLAWILRPAGGERAHDSAGRPVDVPLKSIAVLPFDDMSEDGDQRYLADGLSEEILDRLAQLPGLKVTGRVSSFALRDSQASFGKIAELLGVVHLLEGSVRKEGDEVRVKAQLINAHDGYHIWSRVYERELTELFQVQDQIAAEIVGELESSLAPGRPDLVSTLPPAYQPGLQAYDRYLRARALIRQQTKNALMSAMEELERALALEPNYALAHIEMARVLMELREYQDYFSTEDEVAAAGRKARMHIDAALAMEPGMAAAHSALGQWYLYVGDDDGDSLQQAEDALRRAIELNPMDARAAPDAVRSVRKPGRVLGRARRSGRARCGDRSAVVRGGQGTGPDPQLPAAPRERVGGDLFSIAGTLSGQPRDSALEIALAGGARAAG